MTARTMALALILGAAASVSAAPLPTGAPATSAAGASVPTKDAGAPPSAEQLKSFDAALSRAEIMVLEVEAVAKGGTGACPPNFMPRLYADLKAKRLGEYGEIFPFLDDLELYQSCLAVRTDQIATCDELKGISNGYQGHMSHYVAASQGLSDEQKRRYEETAGIESVCKKDYVIATMIRSLLEQKPDFAERCRRAADQSSVVRAGQEPVLCEAIRAYAPGREAAFCASLNSAAVAPMNKEYCVGTVGEVLGYSHLCSRLSYRRDVRFCEEVADYRQAFASGGAQNCSGALCKVLFGKGLIECDSFLKPIQAEVCAKHYAPALLPDREREFRALVDGLDKSLAGADVGGGDAKALKAFNARLDRLYELRDRFDKAADEIAPKKAKKGTPDPKTKGS